MSVSSQFARAKAVDPNRILIVDDDADTLANFSDILQDIGYDVTTASGAEAALEIVKKQCPGGNCSFDLCLLDFKMPGMDGVELFTRIREVNPQVRAIMITAYAGEDGVQRAVDAGTWKVLRKPVDIKQLLVLITEAVAQ